jgi:NAD(P)-dependent dehydrogenase (short-subunit alcohol dehydrogenase family)
VRKQADAESLLGEGVAGLEPIALEVSDAASIAAAAKSVAAAVGDAGLAGLVNNAGITNGGPVEYVELDELRRVFEINTFGAVAVTRRSCRCCAARAAGSCSSARSAAA